MPELSIFVVNFNGKKWLEDLIYSVKQQHYTSFEFIFVDNNSSDGSVDYVIENYPESKIVSLSENLGFAGGNNKGFEKANGELILFLNNDTYFGPEFLKKFVSVFDDSKIAIAQSKLVLSDKKNIDSCGSFWTDTTFMYYYGNGKDASIKNYNNPFRVFSVKGASFMVRRSVIEKIGLFDDDFWNYYEETDFCHRAWLAGYESWYCPDAVCYHVMGGTALTFPNEQIQFHNFKNKLHSFLKNMEVRYLAFYIPIFIALNLVISLVWLLQGKFKHSLALFRALYWNFQNLAKAVKKRKKIQNLRKVGDKEIFAKVKRNPNFGYFVHLLNDDLGNYIDKL